VIGLVQGEVEVKILDSNLRQQHQVVAFRCSQHFLLETPNTALIPPGTMSTDNQGNARNLNESKMQG
jgi:hypothetical protein